MRNITRGVIPEYPYQESRPLFGLEGIILKRRYLR